jgi:hypothetical protein
MVVCVPTMEETSNALVPKITMATDVKQKVTHLWLVSTYRTGILLSDVSDPDYIYARLTYNYILLCPEKPQNFKD